MEYVFQVVIGVAVAILSSVVLKMQLRYDVEQKQRQLDFENIKDGVREILNYNMTHIYEKYESLGYCPTQTKITMSRLYKPYHNLGGNGAGTAMYNKIESLPSSPDCKE